jgi:hypothetical protein
VALLTEAMMRIKLVVLFAAIAMLLMLSLSGCAETRGPWNGKVVESGSLMPIDGAAVVAKFYEVYGGGWAEGPDAHYYDAVETVTDKDGFFSIPKRTFTPTLKKGYRLTPDIIIFKPGYASFKEVGIKLKKDIPDRDIFIVEVNVVELPKWNDENKRGHTFEETYYDLFDTLNFNDYEKCKAKNAQKMIIKEGHHFGWFKDTKEIE